MSDSGWVNETHPKIPDAVIKAVVHELEGKRGISVEGLSKFIKSLRKSWGTAFRPRKLVDTEMTNYRFEQVMLGARKVDSDMRSLSKALNALDQHERELLEDQIGPLGQQISFLDQFSADAVAEAAEGLARDFARSRGGYERIDGPTGLFVYLSAKSWEKSFNSKPSPKPNSLFAKAINAALQANADINNLEFDRLGRDALRRLMGSNGGGKSPKVF